MCSPTTYVTKKHIMNNPGRVLRFENEMHNHLDTFVLIHTTAHVYTTAGHKLFSIVGELLYLWNGHLQGIRCYTKHNLQNLRNLSKVNSTDLYHSALFSLSPQIVQSLWFIHLRSKLSASSSSALTSSLARGSSVWAGWVIHEYCPVKTTLSFPSFMLFIHLAVFSTRSKWLSYNLNWKNL